VLRHRARAARQVARRAAGRVARRVVSGAGGTATAPAGGADATPDPADAPDQVDAPDVRLLVESPLLDLGWYARVTGFSGTRAEAAADYLRRPATDRPLTHPLFLRDHVAAELEARWGDEVRGRDPLLVYLRRGLRFPTHPLFDVEAYAGATPGARRHARGAFGHYLEADPAVRASGADWLPAGGPGLEEWVVAQHDAWRERHVDGQPQVVRRGFLAPPPATPPPGTGLATQDEVVVVVEAGRVPEQLRESLASLAAQTHRRWRAVVVDPGMDGCRELVAEVLGGVDDRRWLHLVAGPGVERPAVLAEVLRTASEELPPSAPGWVALLRSGETWVPERLARLLAHAYASGSRVVCDVLEETRADQPPLLLGRGMPSGSSSNPGWTELSRLLVSQDLLAEVEVPSVALGRGWEFELVSRLARPAGVEPLRAIGVRRRPGLVRLAHRLPVEVRPRVVWEDVPTAAHEVLGERLVDWEALGSGGRESGLTSVVVPTYRDWRMTSEAVASVLAADGEVEVVVVDNGCGPQAAAILASLPERDARVRVVHMPTNLGFALGCNVGFAATRGDVVVFLNDDTTVAPDWLAPLREALADPDVLGAQSLLTYPTGTVQCAGVLVPGPGGTPYPLLQGFPTLDAAHVAQVRLPALTGAALALRASDVVALRGFDPVFLNGMEDVDLCLRLSRSRKGHYVCRPDSRVVHHESRTPGRYAHLGINRRFYLERWEDVRGDDAAAWRTVGYDLVGHDPVPEGRLPRETWVPEPVLRRRRPTVVESPPRLRWAIKNPAPALPVGDRWGDTHFADSLAAALRSLGQDVVIDRRQEHDRRTGRYDDVELVLRGLAPYRPTPVNVSLCWVISHPEMLPLGEAALYDRVLAASETWSREQGARWGIEVEPLLQATDPSLFHPDRAVPDTGHPVLFVGSSRRVARPMVAAAVERGLPLSVYGREWEGMLDRHHLKGEYLANAEVGAAYRSAGVVLSDHWEDMRSAGFVSNRLFDAAAAGARVLTDDVAGLPDAFGRSVQVLRDPEDLVRLTSLADPDSVFGSDEERREVAARVAREHSFRARAERLVEVALHARRQRGLDG